jgi:hypothetical protein
MVYKIYTNKTTKPKQKIEFLEKIDYETLENFNLKYSFKYTSKQQQNLSNVMNLPSRVNLKEKMKSKHLPLFSNFYGYHTDNSRDSLALCPSEEEEWGTMSSYLYRGIVAMGIVTLVCLSLLMHKQRRAS